MSENLFPEPANRHEFYLNEIKNLNQTPSTSIDATAVSAVNSAGFMENFRNLRSAAKSDYRGTGIKGKLLLGSVILMSAYEWGPGNETVTPYIVGTAVDSSDGLKGAAITAGVGFLFTYIQQRTSAFLTRRTAQRFPNTSDESFKIMGSENPDSGHKPFFEQSTSTKLASSFLIGSSWNTAREIALTGSLDDDKLKSVGKRSALIAAAAVGTLSLAVDGIDQIVPDDSIGQAVIDFLKSPTPYLAGVVLYFGNEYKKGRKS